MPIYCPVFPVYKNFPSIQDLIHIMQENIWGVRHYTGTWQKMPVTAAVLKRPSD